MTLQLTKREEFTSKEAVLVGTDQLATTQEVPVVTNNASGCLIIIFHADGKGGGMAHIPPGDDDLPAMKKMLESLTKQRVSPGQVEILIAGGLGREYKSNWRQDFIHKLSQLGIQLGNVIDARMQSETSQKTPIGNSPREGFQVAAYDPKTGQVLPLSIGQQLPALTSKKTSGVKLYTVADKTGELSPAQDGACVIL